MFLGTAGSAMFAALTALTMKTIITSNSRPLRRALWTLFLGIAALWAMLRNAQAQLLYVGQLIRSAMESRAATLSGLFTLNRKPAKSVMSVELGMIPMLYERGQGLNRRLPSDKEGNQEGFSFQILQMNNSHFSMHYLATVALLLFVSMSVALAEDSVSGKVNRIDLNAHTFTVKWTKNPGKRIHSMYPVYFKESTFKTTSKTTYLVPLQNGIIVTVAFHKEGSDRIADAISGK